MKLYIVRHGQTDWNAKRVMQGNTDVPLNEVGIEQALRIQRELSNVHFNICISSPLKRAYKTASIICDDKIDIKTDVRLEERELGELEGKSVDLYNSKMYWDYSLNSSAQGVESIQDLFSRISSFYEDLKEKYDEETILIVAHGAVVRALHFVINGYNKNTSFLDFDVPNCKVFMYEIN